MSRRKETKTGQNQLLIDTQEDSPRGKKDKKRTRRNSSSKGKSRSALSTLQVDANDSSLLVGSGEGKQTRLKFPSKQKEPSKQKDSHRYERIARSTSPALPEISVVVNKNGLLEIEEEKEDIISRVSFGVQTEAMDFENKGVQTELPPEESIHYRMCTEETPPIEYWQKLAEQRRIALLEALTENEHLYEKIEELKEAMKEKETKQQHSEYFSFMYKLTTDGNNSSSSLDQ